MATDYQPSGSPSPYPGFTAATTPSGNIGIHEYQRGARSQAAQPDLALQLATAQEQQPLYSQRAENSQYSTQYQTWQHSSPSAVSSRLPPGLQQQTPLPITTSGQQASSDIEQKIMDRIRRQQQDNPQQLRGNGTWEDGIFYQNASSLGGTAVLAEIRYEYENSGQIPQGTADPGWDTLPQAQDIPHVAIEPHHLGADRSFSTPHTALSPASAVYSDGSPPTRQQARRYSPTSGLGGLPNIACVKCQENWWEHSCKGQPCENCQLHGTDCKRSKCINFAAGTCDKGSKCKSVHENDPRYHDDEYLVVLEKPTKRKGTKANATIAPSLREKENGAGDDLWLD